MTIKGGGGSDALGKKTSEISILIIWIPPFHWRAHKGQNHMITAMPWFGYLSLLDSAILISMSAFSLAALIRSCYDSGILKRISLFWSQQKKMSLAWQKNHLERQNAWKVWSLKGPLSCSKSKKAKGWVWHLSYWTSDFRLFIFDIKHLNLTHPILGKKQAKNGQFFGEKWRNWSSMVLREIFSL